MTGGARLRAHLDEANIVQAPGVYDGMTAKLVEAAGFPVAYMSGYGVAASYGKRDVGVVGLHEMAYRVIMIANAIDIPFVADADTGYDDIAQTVETYRSAGAAGIQLEDQAWPKRCGHMDDKVLVSTDEMSGRLRDAVAARGESDLVIIARTDAIAVEGFDAALERAAAYADTGVDVLFVEAPESIEQLREIPKQLSMLPHIVNVAPKTPSLPAAEYEAMGYALAIYPGIVFAETMRAASAALDGLKRDGLQSNLDDWKTNFQEWNALFDEE